MEAVPPAPPGLVGGADLSSPDLAPSTMIVRADSVAAAPAISHKLGDWLFFNVTRAFAALTLVILAGIIISLLISSWPALQKFGIAYLWTRDWNPPVEQ